MRDLSTGEFWAVWVICGLILFGLGFLCGIIFMLKEK